MKDTCPDEATNKKPCPHKHIEMICMDCGEITDVCNYEDDEDEE